MAKRRSTKGQTTIYEKIHIKLKIEQHEPGRVSSSCSSRSRKYTCARTCIVGVCLYKVDWLPISIHYTVFQPNLKLFSAMRSKVDLTVPWLVSLVEQEMLTLPRPMYCIVSRCVLCMYLTCYLYTIVLTKVTRNKDIYKHSHFLLKCQDQTWKMSGYTFVC